MENVLLQLLALLKARLTAHKRFRRKYVEQREKTVAYLTLKHGIRNYLTTRSIEDLPPEEYVLPKIKNISSRLHNCTYTEYYYWITYNDLPIKLKSAEKIEKIHLEEKLLPFLLSICEGERKAAQARLEELK